MVTDIKGNWDAETIDVPSTTVPKKIATLRGGESITIKSLASDGAFHYIGKDRYMTTAHAYLMDAGDVITLAHDISFGENNAIDIYALASSAGDDVCYFKLTDRSPKTAGM